MREGWKEEGKGGEDECVLHPQAAPHTPDSLAG